MTTTNLFDTYNVNTTYTTNDVIFFNGNIYQSKVICQGIIPLNATYWNLISGNFTFQGISFEGVWNNSKSYNEGEYVTYNGAAYISNSSNNLNHTPGSSAQWTAFNISLVTSERGDMQYQGANTLTRLAIGNTNQVLVVSPAGYPAWSSFSSLLPSGNVNQVLTLTGVGQATWSDIISATSLNANAITSNTLNTGVITSTSLSTGSVTTSGNVTIGGDLYVTGTTTTINTEIQYATEFANVTFANVSTVGVLTANVLTSNTNTLRAVTSNTITSNVITSNVINSNTQTTGNLIINNTTTIHEVLESANIQSSGAGNTMNIIFSTGGVFYYTGNSTSNVTFNFIYDNSTPLNSFMSIGQSLTGAILMSQGNTAYYPTTVKIDNNTVTTKWANGTSPSSGNPNSIDVYTFSIIKTANAVYTVLGSATKFS